MEHFDFFMKNWPHKGEKILFSKIQIWTVNGAKMINGAF